ncbi:MAG: HAMP domain-containing sensor histidine kinase [Pseudomonadota bacterium]
MERQTSLLASRGVTDERDVLLSADDALADLQERCGGTIPGALAVPELLELVREGRRLGLKIAREFSAYDGEAMVSGFVRIHPRELDAGEGCELLIENWQTRLVPQPNSRDTAARLDAIDRACAEVTARLDDGQRIQLFNASGLDTMPLQQSVAEAPGSLWTDHVTLKNITMRQPVHWRLLDGAQCRIEGSQRLWRARLMPIGPSVGDPRGFELLLVADYPLASEPEEGEGEGDAQTHAQLIGGALTPVLRQPIARIIANAETIRSRLAGPLMSEYSEYAGNIASAGQHLNGLLDDLVDLEVVEAPDFSTASEAVDLGDAARRAGGILGVRARAKNIELVTPIAEARHIATGEFRRVLQILINLIGNAIAYSPENSVVTITASSDENERTVSLTVMDEGAGIETDQAERIFNKFERLGREGDGGSGLGLYISSRLAEAMGGGLDVANPGEEGAQFRLTLPIHTAP